MSASNNFENVSKYEILRSIKMGNVRSALDVMCSQSHRSHCSMFLSLFLFLSISYFPLFCKNIPQEEFPPRIKTPWLRHCPLVSIAYRYEDIYGLIIHLMVFSASDVSG